MKRKTPQEFIAELHQNNPNVIAIGTYVNYSTKVEVICKKCNHVWFA